MKPLRQVIAGVRRRLDERRFPFVVTLRDFDSAGVRFEVSNLVERLRIIDHGSETDYTAAMIADLRKDDVLFDVGANVGMVALHAAKICQVVAFEPDPYYGGRLKNNMALNPNRPFTIESVAVSDKDGSLTLHTEGGAGTSPSLVRQRGETASVVVSGRSLDSLIAEGRLPRPTVIKLDIEGAEILALRGGLGLLSGPNRPRALYVELHDTFLGGFESSADEVYELLREFGYTKKIYSSKRDDQTHLILYRD